MIDLSKFAFKKLIGFDKIIITGAQRSGTTICSKMIADIMGDEYDLIDEKDFGTHDEEAFQSLLYDEGKLIIQAPAQSHTIHRIWNEKIFIIFMVRDIEDIMNSQQRIQWTKIEEPREKLKYYKEFRCDVTAPISLIKKYIFYSLQRTLIPESNLSIIHYEDLKDLNPKLWIDSQFRKEFDKKQTVPDLIPPNKLLKEILKDGGISKENYNYYYQKYINLSSK